MSADTIKIAVAGLGWGSNSARDLKDMDMLGAVVTEIHGHQLSSAQAYCASNNVLGINWEQAMADSGIVALVIATPVHTHAEYSMEALNVGKHIYVEKPVALSVAELNPLNKVAQSNGLILMPGHQLLFHPGYQFLKSLIKNGKIGNIVGINCRRQFPGTKTNGCVISDLLPHDAALAIDLLGHKRLAVYGKYFCEARGGPSYVAQITLSSGSVTANLHLSRVHNSKRADITIIGTKGTLRWCQIKSCVKYYALGAGRGPTEVYPIDPKDFPLPRALKHFVSCIQTGTVSPSAWLDLEAVTRVLEGALKLSPYYQPIGRQTVTANFRGGYAAEKLCL